MKPFLLAAAALLSLPVVHAANGIERLTLPGNQYYYGGYGNNWIAADGSSAILGGDMMYGGSFYYSANAGLVAVEQIITGVPSTNYYHGQLYGYSIDGTRLLYRSYSGNLNGDYLVNAAAGTSQLISVAGPGYTNSRGLSANGLHVVGSYYISGGNVTRGFLWSAAGTPVTDIGASFGNDSYLSHVSNDGTMALGGFNSNGNAHAFVWKSTGNAETSFAQVANLSAGLNSYLTYVKADLSVALLHVYGNNSSTIYRWSPATGQFTHLDLSAVNAYSDATGLSADGSTVIAIAGSKVHRWTAAGWDLDLTASFSGVQNAYSSSNNYNGYGTGASTNISADGTALVGTYYTNNQSKPFFWSTTTGAIDLLASMPGAHANGYPVISADGKVVFGGLWNGSTSTVYRWSAARGTQTLTAWLQSYGVDLTPFANWTFEYANATSSDGAVLLGTARESQGMPFPFIATAKGVTDVNAWMSTVVGANSFYAMGHQLSHLPMEGAHHRPLASYGDLGGLNSFWATGDFGKSTEGAKSDISTGEVGMSTTVSPQIIMGVAVGRGRQSQELALGGSSLVEGNYYFLEGDYKLAEGGVLSVTLSAGSWKGELDRGYVVGANIDHSIGNADASSRSARLRYDTPFRKFADKFSVGAFGSFTWTALEVDAYAEAGGAFPATYDRQNHTSREARIGLVGVYVVNEAVEVRVSAQVVHRLDDAQPTLTGTDVTGNLPFAMAGTQNVKNQGRYGLELDHRLDKRTILNYSLQASGVGSLPEVSGAISFRRGF